MTGHLILRCHTYMQTYSPLYQQTGHRSSRGSRSSGSGSGSGTESGQAHTDTAADGREKMSPPNFKVTSASLQINDHLIATDHEFVLNDEDSEKLNEHAGQVTPPSLSLPPSLPPSLPHSLSLPRT